MCALVCFLFVLYVGVFFLVFVSFGLFCFDLCRLVGCLAFAFFFPLVGGFVWVFRRDCCFLERMFFDIFLLLIVIVVGFLFVYQKWFFSAFPNTLSCLPVLELVFSPSVFFLPHR